MNAKALNNLSRDIFSYKSNNNQKIKVCSADGKSRDISRDELISAGRLATAEYFGRIANATKNNTIKYLSKVEDYASFSRNTWVETVVFCAAQANKAIGKAPYSNMKEVENDLGLYKNPIFLNALQSITQEVITPLLPAVMDGITDRLVMWDRGRIGETKLVDITSNDFFVFDDDSWGSVSSKPYQYLYKSQIAVTPKPYTAKTKIKWYQDIVDGEAGRYYAAFARGAASKMYAMTLGEFNKAVANSKYMPSGMVIDGFSLDNWNQALMQAQALNGVSRNQLMALGSLAGLSKILPTVGTDGAVAGIQGEIGTEFVKNGFLANVAGVDLIEAGLTVVPGTQNYEPKFLGLDSATKKNVYVMAKLGYAPMVGVIAEGSPITITFTPRETADMTIDIEETLIFNIKPAFSSKIINIQI